MIVGRLATVTGIILDEYKESGVLELLDRAIALAAERGTLPPVQYQKEVYAIRSEADRISNRRILDNIPADLEIIFSGGSYGNILPKNLANLINFGVLPAKQASLSSNELSVYKESVTNFINTLRVMLEAFHLLDLDEIVVPEGKVSIDLIIPRSAISNKVSDYLAINAAFDDIIQYIQELVGLPADPPQLVYTSTSDPATGYAVAIGVVTPLIIFYDQILSVAQKQIDLIKSVRAIRNIVPDAPLPDESIVSESVKKLTRAGVETAVDKIAASSGDVVEEGRKAELKNAITLKSHILVTAVSNGTRSGLSVESQISLETTFASHPLELADLRELIASTKPLEAAVEASLRLLDQRIPLLEGPDRDVSAA